METQKDFSARLATVKAEIRAARAFFDQFDADGKPVSYTRAARELRAMGLKVTRSEDLEIRVAFPGNESAAYYTDSVEDAAFTGLDMVARAELGATVEDDREPVKTVSAVAVSRHAFQRAFRDISRRCERAVEAPEFFDAFEFETVDSLEFNLASGSF